MGSQFSRKRILIVDDNRDAADLISQLLDLHGYDTATAYDGPGGIEAVKQFLPDLVMLDLGMPGMDGYAVAIEMRRVPETREMVLVAFTAWGDAETRAKTVASGFDYHVVKPVSLERLLHTVSLVRRSGGRAPD
jgi:CheY-like chemotaxis protein